MVSGRSAFVGKDYPACTTVSAVRSPTLTALMSPLFEITSGLAKLPQSARIWAYIVLPFGGLSCIAQTYSCIQGTGLSMKEYVFHKAVLTAFTAMWYQAVPLL